MAYVGQPQPCHHEEEHPIPGTRLVAYRRCTRTLHLEGGCESHGHLYTHHVDGFRVVPSKELVCAGDNYACDAIIRFEVRADVEAQGWHTEDLGAAAVANVDGENWRAFCPEHSPQGASAR